MISGTLHKLREISRRLWVRAALISLLAFLAAASTPIVAYVVPDTIKLNIDSQKLRSLLDIIANSMLAVTTFSLTVMVTAHLHAAGLASPRAHRILSQDSRTQIVMATFVGSFVYSLFAIVMIQLEMVGEDTFATLYLMTLLVVFLIIVTILRWIAHLTELGSIEETTRRIEGRTSAALQRRLDSPYLGGRCFTPETQVPEDAHVVSSNKTGFVQHVNTAGLSETIEEHGGNFYLHAMPGDWLGLGDRIAEYDGEELTDELEEKLNECITLADVRSFSQDVEFGIRVMAEIAERALSPGVNDPRTATDVITRLVTLLEPFEGEVEQDEPEAPNVYVKPLDLYRIMRMGFDPISRDGRAFVEVQLHVQTALKRLSRHNDRIIASSARTLSSRALAFAEMGLQLESDLAKVREVAIVDRASDWTDPLSRETSSDQTQMEGDDPDK